jgi:hypothetical protein
MLTRGLEEAIQKGLAQYKTFVFGAGGVGRIPVPDESFIIITGFKYFYFIDTITDPLIAPAPAVSTFQVDGGASAFILSYQINGQPGVSNIPIDPADVGQSFANFQSFLDGAFPGFTVSGSFLAGIWTFTVTTTTPGNIYNGITPALSTFPPLPFPLVESFHDGSPGFVSLQQIIANATHQLEFRSTKSRNHYLIRENFNIFTGEIFGAPPYALFWNVNGYYEQDCYLVHTEDVQINILKVPPVEEWATGYFNLAEKSQEFASPVGYGIGVAGLPTINVLDFNGAVFPPELYHPLTDKFTDLPGDAQDEFKVNADSGRELTDPVTPNAGINNGRNYPLVNIEYVLINKDYNDYVKNS